MAALKLEQLDAHFVRNYNYRVFTLGIAQTGAWAFIFLFCALACTPVQRLTGFRWPGELRRILGLFAFKNHSTQKARKYVT